jgi:protein phosphatase
VTEPNPDADQGSAGSTTEPPVVEPRWFDVGAVSDVGTEREHNEDHCGFAVASATSAVVVVADGVSSYEAGETASSKAVEVTLREYADQPASLPPAKRLARAVQQANIEVYDLAIVVPELRGMATTLTALALDRGELSVAHVGDSRLYLMRDGGITQLTKDHTVAAERRRVPLLGGRRAPDHADHHTLTRSLGRELIVAIDRISTRVLQGDLLLLCSDGLYNVIDEREMLEHATAAPLAADGCRALVDAANRRGTVDNLTAAVVRVVGPADGAPARPATLRDRLKRLIGQRRQ